MVLAHNVIDEERTEDIKISQDVTFDTMLLTPQTLQGLKSSGFYKPSPIQLHGIPLGKCGFDLLLEAKSGTGKTAVFTVISLEKINLKKNVQVIVLSPTREIAAQICDVMQQIGSYYKGLRVEVVMGGLSVQEDINKFKNKVHIVVGSPGRLRHLIHDNYIDVSSVQLLVLDEADKLLEGNFLPDINYIFSVLPLKKQVIMSSATYPEQILPFISKYVQNAQHICPDSNSILIGIAQKFTIVKNNTNIVKRTQNRFEELLKILSHQQFKQCLIFCNYQVRVGELYKMLTREKWPAQQLYGQQEQILRLDALKTLQEYKCRILIATDLAARGIDASNVDLVINFEPPIEWQTYLHRIGRAGRYGSYGLAVTIICEGKEEKMFLDNLSDSMKFNLELTNYWTNSKLKNTILESLPDINTSPDEKVVYSIEDSYDELWNNLTLETQNLCQQIESFEDLCNSLKKVNNSDIEKFSDLLNSFHNMDYSIDGNDFNYKHIINAGINVNEILFTLKNRDFLNSDEIIDINENIKTYKSDKDNINGKLHDPLNYSNLNNSLKYSTGYSNAANYSNEEDIEIRDDKKAMLKAGLPTAFSSKKHIERRKLFKCKNQKIKSNSESKPVNNTHNIENPEEDNNNTSNKCSSNFVSIKDEFKCDTRNYSVNNNTIDLNCNKFNINKESSKSKRNNSEKKLSASNLVCNSQVNNSINLDYETWYRQLKTNINYIEQSWYVHELSQV